MVNFDKCVCEKCGNEILFHCCFSEELDNKLPKPWSDCSELCVDCFLVEIKKTYPNQKISINDFTLVYIGLGYRNFGGTIMDTNSKDKKVIYIN